MSCILSIDIGIIHLAYCVTWVSEDFTEREILWVDMVDITHFRHSIVKSEECTLYHTRTFCDWVDHFLQEHSCFFDMADIILIERQPPCGHVAVEQLLFSRYRDKTQLIHPRRVHQYLCLSHLDYEHRKEYSVKIADREMPEHLIEQTYFYDRRHDIADSVCIMLYYTHKKKEEYRRKRRMETLTRDMTGMTIMEKLELFRF